MNDSDLDRLLTDLNRLREETVENTMKINPGKSKAVSLTAALMEDPLYYFGGNKRIPEANS
jgi:hypothetical protein